MPTIGESTLQLSTPVIEPTSGESTLITGTVTPPILRSTLHASEVLDTVTQQANAQSGALPTWKITPIGKPQKPIIATPGVLPPSAPLTVSNSFVSNAVGYAFAFYLVNGVAGYNIYRATSSAFSSATLVNYLSQPFTNIAQITVSDPMVHGSATYYYWVTSVNSSGIESLPAEVGSATGTAATPYTPGTPQQVTGVAATESPWKTPNGVIYSLVEVSFTPAVGDTYFQGVNIYFTGYNGSFIPQLMSSATQSPASFLCETTHETVTVTVVAVGSEGYDASFSLAPTASVTLNGAWNPPAPPSIAQGQTALDGNIGWQFTFNVIGGLEADQIQCYRVYHSESNVAPSNYFRTIPQPISNSGQEVVQETTGDILFYWVSAVNSVGLESTLVPVPFVYIDPGTPPPNVNPIVTTPKSSSPTVLLNGWGVGAHVGWWETQDSTNGTNFGLGKYVVNPLTDPTYACDGNQATAASFWQAHNAEYAGCVWSFSNFTPLASGVTVQSATLSILSEVAATSGPVHGEASIYYSLDNGTTWTQVYLASYQVGNALRTKQTDTVTIPTTQNFANIQVMACCHSHDDLAMNVYEISLSITQSANPNPQQVTGVTASLVGGDVQLTWNGLVPLTRTDITGYEVYRSLHGAGYIASHLQTTITSTGAATYSWTDIEAHDGSFDYWVIGVSNTGWSPASNPPAFLHNSTSVLYLNGTTLESLKPAQPGADVTLQNTDILLQNPNFLAGNSGWYSTAGIAGSVVAGVGYLGSPYVGAFPANATGALSNSQNIPCSAGANLSAGCFYMGASGLTANAVIRITYYNGAGTTLAYTDLGSVATWDGTWRQARGTLVAPAGTAYANVAMVVYGTGVAGTIYGGGATCSILSNTIDEVPNGTTYSKVLSVHVVSGSPAYSDGIPIDSLQPSQVGADVTHQNALTLLQNPNFAAGNTGWVLSSGWSIVGGTPLVPGSGYVAQFSTSTTTTSAITNSQSTPCAAGTVVMASCWVLGGTGAVASPAVIRANFYNSSGALVSSNEGNWITSPGSWQQSRVSIVAPANSAYLQIDFAVFNGTGTWDVCGFAAAFHSNSVDEIPDGVTYGRPLQTHLVSGVPAYAGGVTIDSLQPAQAGADVTSQHTSADTTNVFGNPSATVAQGATGINKNLVPDSSLQFGWTYWAYSTNPSAFQIGWGDAGMNEFKLPSATQTTYNDNGVLNKSVLIPVTAGLTYTLSAFINTQSVTIPNGGGYPGLYVYSEQSGQEIAQCSPFPGSAPGRVVTSFVIPSGTTSIYLCPQTRISTCAAGFTMEIGAMMLQSGSVATAYVPNTVDDLTGYMLAGSTQIDLSSSMHLNKTANYISYTSGGSVDSYKPAQAGADVTSQHTAADTSAVSGVASSRVSSLALGTSSNDLISNGGFENGLTGWTNSSASIDTSTFYAGTQSVDVLAYVSQSVNLIVGHVYSYSAWIKTAGNTGNSAGGPVLAFSDPSNLVNPLSVSGGAAINYGGAPGVLLPSASAQPWTFVQMVFEANASGSLLAVLSANYGSSAANTASTWVDSMSLVDVTAINPVPTSIYGPTGNAIDQHGNVKLKNLNGIGGVTIDPTVSTTAFADLPELGTGNASMTMTTLGNPCLTCVNLVFSATTGGGSTGPVTAIGWSPGGTYTGTTPPTISISISGNGTGAGASVSWAQSGAGPNYTWTPSLSIFGGSGYTSATATVVISGSTGGGYTNGTNTYTCTVQLATTVSGAVVQVRVLIDGNILMGIYQGVSDSSGVVLITATHLAFPPAGSHSFEVQALNLTSADTVVSTYRTFALIELG